MFPSSDQQESWSVHCRNELKPGEAMRPFTYTSHEVNDFRTIRAKT